MKHSELKQIIKEEIRKVLNENELPDLRIGDYIKVKTKDGEVMGIVTSVNRDSYEYKQVENIGDKVNPYNRGGMVDGSNFIAKNFKGQWVKENPSINEEPQSKNTFRPILLPSIDGGSYTEVPTFEKYAQWRAKFKSEYGQYPEFDKSDSKKWKVTNPKFVEKQQMYDKAVMGFGTKGD